MSIIANPDWQGKLKSSKNERPNEEQIKIINRFNREEIFNHKYDIQSLFSKFYKLDTTPVEQITAKRQVNSFMILRTVLGLVAAKGGIKRELGDGTQQSKIAGFIWGGADPSEKKRFEELSTQFKEFHKIFFPHYEYKPTPKAQAAGCTFVDPIISSSYSQTIPVVPSSLMSYQDSAMSPTSIAEQYNMINNNEFAATVIEGSSFQNESSFAQTFLEDSSFQNEAGMGNIYYQQFPFAETFLEGTAFQNKHKTMENDYVKFPNTSSLNEQSDFDLLNGSPAPFEQPYINYLNNNINNMYGMTNYDQTPTDATNIQFSAIDDYYFY